MAITYVAVGARANTSGATSRVPALPATRSNGDLLVAICGSKNNATHSVSGAGWTKLTQVNSGASWTVSLYWCIVNGSEAAPTISWTGSVASFAHVMQYRGTSTLPFGVSNVNTGTTSTHSCTQITTTSPNSMVVAWDAAADNVALATPSGWTEDFDAGSATGLTRDTEDSKTVATSGTGSGNISVTGANAAWVMWQYELQSPTALTVADGTHAHSTDAISLTQVHVLSVADGAHAHSTDAIDLTQVYVLTVADGAHAHSSDAISLTQVHVLTVADGAHAHSTDAITITEVSATNLSVADGTHAHSTDAISLTQVHVLTVADGAHGHASDAISLTQVHVLTVADGTHAQSADHVEISVAVSLSVADGWHDQSVENITISQVHSLQIADGEHAHSADEIDLTQVHVLFVADGTHEHLADVVELMSSILVGNGEPVYASVRQDTAASLRYAMYAGERVDISASARFSMNASDRDEVRI